MRLQAGCRRYPSGLQGVVREVNRRHTGRLYSFRGVVRLTPAVTRNVSMRPAAPVVKTKKGPVTGAFSFGSLIVIATAYGSTSPYPAC